MSSRSACPSRNSNAAIGKTAIGNISGTVKLLQEFGNTRVLSSPKLMALNNQTALLKVVDDRLMNSERYGRQVRPAVQDAGRIGDAQPVTFGAHEILRRNAAVFEHQLTEAEPVKSHGGSVLGQ